MSLVKLSHSALKCIMNRYPGKRFGAVLITIIKLSKDGLTLQYEQNNITLTY